jgi:integrative and conjugative element protein (TIGR02256 family)
MQLLLPSGLIQRLQSELKRAGNREIGGLLMGEHVRDEVFRVVDISVQRSGGDQACFIRQPKDHQKTLEKFFARTRNDFTRFNYLGEWHSHPSFVPIPSSTDVTTMRSMVADPAVGANFLVLLIAKRSFGGNFEASATLFTADAPPRHVALEHEPPLPAEENGPLKRLARRIFSF